MFAEYQHLLEALLCLLVLAEFEMDDAEFVVAVKGREEGRGRSGKDNKSLCFGKEKEKESELGRRERMKEE